MIFAARMQKQYTLNQGIPSCKSDPKSTWSSIALDDVLADYTLIHILPIRGILGIFKPVRVLAR